MSVSHSAKKGLEEESGPLSSDSARRRGGAPPSGPHSPWSAGLQEKQRPVHQASSERLSLRAQGGQAAGGTQVLQRGAEGDAVQEALRLRLALLFPRGRGGAGPARLPRHHQAAHGPEHHPGKAPPPLKRAW